MISYQSLLLSTRTIILTDMYTVLWKFLVWNYFVDRNIWEKFLWFLSTNENYLKTD